YFVLFLFFFFFFQAEDGIRDKLVNGVQTCALPIFTFFVARAHDVVATWVLVVYAIVCVVAAIGWTRYWFGPVGRQRAAAFALLRSEERRVGKECRCGWGR